MKIINENFLSDENEYLKCEKKWYDFFEKTVQDSEEVWVDLLDGYIQSFKNGNPIAYFYSPTLNRSLRLIQLRYREEYHEELKYLLGAHVDLKEPIFLNNSEELSKAEELVVNFTLTSTTEDLVKKMIICWASELVSPKDMENSISSLYD